MIDLPHPDDISPVLACGCPRQLVIDDGEHQPGCESHNAAATIDELPHPDDPPLRDDCYHAAWAEPQNTTPAAGIRAMLQAGHAQVVVFQPGDMTRYRFLLVPAPLDEIEVSGPDRDGCHREPTALPSPCPGALFVTVLDGLGGPADVGYFEHAVNIRSANGIDGIRHRIAEKMRIGNPCTAEALAQTVYAVWSDEAERAC